LLSERALRPPPLAFAFSLPVRLLLLSLSFGKLGSKCTLSLGGVFGAAVSAGGLAY